MTLPSNAMADDDPPSSESWDGMDLRLVLRRWAADASAADTAASRSRERWLRHQAGESATLIGVLVDLAERGRAATVTTLAGVHTGEVVGVGRDFCVMASPGSTLLALSSVVSVAPLEPLVHGYTASPPAASDGDREAPLDLDLEEVLSRLAADRSPVRLVLAGGTAVTGTLWATGDGIVVCRSEGPGRRMVTVVSAAVTSCTPR